MRREADRLQSLAQWRMRVKRMRVGHVPQIRPFGETGGERRKSIMGGVGPNFRWIANGRGYGAGTWEKPRGQYGVAQLSPWLLFPLDGLNLKQGTSAELFG